MLLDFTMNTVVMIGTGISRYSSRTFCRVCFQHCFILLYYTCFWTKSSSTLLTLKNTSIYSYFQVDVLLGSSLMAIRDCRNYGNKDFPDCLH